MHKKVIELALSVDSIKKSIKEVNSYKKWVVDKTSELTKRLADIGLETAKVIFSVSRPNDTETANVELQVQEVDNGYKVVANGQQVCFIEFGAGVHYNKSDPYPEARPSGIVGIGEYGYGQGKKDQWKNPNTGEMTYGTRATMPMYNAGKDMRESIEKIVSEVFV